MTISSLVLTDGTLTATLTDGTNYALVDSGWQPQVTQRLDDALGGLMFSDVTEEITINLNASSLATLLSNEQKLTKLLDNAQRFANGDLTITPVTIAITMSGSTAKTALCLGGNYQRPATFAFYAPTNEINGAKITIIRTGLWLATADSPASSSATSAGTLWATTHADHTIPSPCVVSWTMPTQSSSDVYESGTQLLICSDNSGDIIVQEGEAYANGSTKFTNVVVTNGRGGNVLLFTATAADTVYTSTTVTSIPTGLATAGMYAIYASIARENTTASAQIRMHIRTRMVQDITTPWVDVTYTGTVLTAEPILLGVVAIPPTDAIASMRIEGISSVSGACYDVDYFYFVRLSPDVTILSITNQQVTSWAGAALEERIDHATLTSLQPIATFGKTDGTLRTGMSYGGQATIYQRGTSLNGVLFASNGTISGSFDGLYRQVSSGGGVFSSTFTVTRSKAYLVPE